MRVQSAFGTEEAPAGANQKIIGPRQRGISTSVDSGDDDLVGNHAVDSPYLVEQRAGTFAVATRVRRDDPHDQNASCSVRDLLLVRITPIDCASM